MGSKPIRILELDALRGIAALAVVLYHYTVRFGELYGYQTTPLLQVSRGGDGVYLFFVISGFVILMTLNKTRRPLDFVVSRASRIYFTFWAAVITTFTVVSVFGLPGREYGVGVFLLNLTMLQTFMVGASSIDGVYWTLYIEIIFYLIMFAIYALKQLHRIEWIGLLWLVLSLAVMLSPGQELLVGKLLARGLILRYAYLFVAGMLFYKIFMKDVSRLTYIALACCIVASPFLAPRESLPSVLASFGVFFLFIFGRLRFLNARPLLFLGTISYALYVVHQNVGYVVMRWLQSLGASDHLAIVAAILVAVSLATAITFLIEKPLIAITRAHYSRWKEQAPRLRPSTSHFPGFGPSGPRPAAAGRAATPARR